MGKRAIHILLTILVAGLVSPLFVEAARTSVDWVNLSGTSYIQPNFGSLGLDLLILGSNRYVNFNTVTGASGYGIRDNAGSMEFKNSGGAWTGIGSGGVGSSQWATSTANDITPNGGGGIIVNASSTITSGLFSMNGGASTTRSTNTGSEWLTSLLGKLLSTDMNGLVSATSSIGVNYLTGRLPFANFTQVSANSVLGNITGSTADASSVATSSLFNIAAASVTGLLSGADWTTFNNKANTASPTFTGTLTMAGFIDTASSTVTAGLLSLNGGASTTALTITGPAYDSSVTASRVLALDNNGLLIATTSIGNNYIAASGVSGSSCTNCNLSYNTNGIITVAANGSAGSLGYTAWGGSVATTYGTSTVASTTAAWFKIGLYASTTVANPAIIDNLKTTNATTATLYITGLTSAILGVDNNNQVVATSSIGPNYIKTVANSILTTDSSGNGIASSTIGITPLGTIAANSVLGTIGASGVVGVVATSSLFNTAAASVTGLLSGTDWTTFNGKQAALSGGVNGMLTAWSSASTIVPTSTPTVANISATSTTATSTFSGNIMIDNNVGNILFPNSPFGVFGSSTAMFASTFLNTVTGKLGGASSSVDIILGNASTTKNATGVTSYFGDIGLNSPNNVNASSTGFAAHALYVKSSDSELDLATASTSGNGIRFYTGGTLTANLRGGVNALGIWSLPNASTTNLTVATSFYTPFASGVVIADSNKLTSAAGATTCTNQFVRAMSAAYVATCAAVSLTADVTGTLGVGNGGTGVASFTANSLLYSNAAGNALAYAATSSLNIGGTSANVTGTVAIANGGTATTTGGVNKGVIFYDGIAHTNSSAFTFSTTSPFALLTVTNASTTYASASTGFFGSFASAVWLADANKLATAATTQTCTNQFVRAMSAAYAATCATVGAADVSLANLSATDSTLTFSGTYTGATARTIGVNLANANTWTGLQTLNASTTNLTIATFLTIPNSATQSPLLAGQLALDTTNQQLVIGTGTGTTVFDPRKVLTLSLGTSTAWTGSSTIPSFVIPIGLAWTSLSCIVQPGGATLNAQYQYANSSAYTTVFSTMIPASGTPGVYALTSNNVPTAQATSTITFGTPTGSPTSASCTLVGTTTAT